MTDEAKSTPKKGGIMKKALVALVLLGIGGGGTYAAFAMGFIGHHGAEKEEDHQPKRVLKEEEDPYLPATGEAESQIEVVHGKGGSKYRTAYFNFTDEFTSNLGGGNALVQTNLAASTSYDGRVLMWLGEHETALRSRILAELASTDANSVMSVEGKEQLQRRLTKALNQVLEEQEGFGGVDNVYFRSFIVQ